MIKKEKKQEIIRDYATKPGDTGSCEVQIAVLTARIKELTEHLKANNNDEHSRLGMIKLVGKRKRLFRYLEKTNLTGARELKKKLEIR